MLSDFNSVTVQCLTQDTTAILAFKYKGHKHTGINMQELKECYSHESFKESTGEFQLQLQQSGRHMYGYTEYVKTY